MAGGFSTAQYVYDIVEAQGLRFPRKRRAYMRNDDLTPNYKHLMVSIDLSNFRFS